MITHINKIIISGMGGSAIVGYCIYLDKKSNKGAIFCSKDIIFLEWVDNSTLVVCSSY